MEIRRCLACGEVLRGRSDKKYCNDQCRSKGNNERTNSQEKYIRNTNKILRRNRTILKTLCPVGKSTVRKTVLEDLGYDFSVFSSLYMPNSGNVYYLCYDYGFSPIVQKGVERALIITRQSYVGDWQPWKFAK